MLDPVGRGAPGGEEVDDLPAQSGLAGLVDPLVECVAGPAQIGFQRRRTKASPTLSRNAAPASASRGGTR